MKPTFHKNLKSLFEINVNTRCPRIGEFNPSHQKSIVIVRGEGLKCPDQKEY